MENLITYLNVKRRYIYQILLALLHKNKQSLTLRYRDKQSRNRDSVLPTEVIDLRFRDYLLPTRDINLLS